MGMLAGCSADQKQMRGDYQEQARGEMKQFRSIIACASFVFERSQPQPQRKLYIPGQQGY